MASEAVSKKGVMLGPFLDRIFMILQTPRGGPRATSGHDCEAKNDPNTIRPNTRHDCEAGSKMAPKMKHTVVAARGAWTRLPSYFQVV